MKKNIVFLIGIIAFSINLNAQSIKASQIADLPYNIPSPSASSLGNYGNIPVSGFTGKAEIQIPLYSHIERGVILDVSLHYDTSGLLINNLPGWTGHGWQLLCGGAITRKINNLPDEINYAGTMAGSDYYLKEYSAAAGALMPETIVERAKQMDEEMKCLNNFKNYFYNASNIPNAKNYNDYILESTGAADYSADIFYFDFMGIHGSFFYGNDGNWKVKCDRNIDVIFDVNDNNNYISNIEEKHVGNDVCQPKTIKGFTLVDDSGNKYTFGGSTSAIEYTTDLMSRHRYNTIHFWNAITWMLKEVRDRFDNVLYTFHYSRDKQIVQFHNSYTYLKENNSPVSLLNNGAKSGTLNSPVYLDRINTFDGTSIIFKHSNVYNGTESYKKLYPNFTKNDLESMITKAYPLYVPILKDSQPWQSFIIGFDSKGHVFDIDLMNMNLEKLNEIIICKNTSNIYSSGQNYSEESVINRYILEYNFKTECT